MEADNIKDRTMHLGAGDVGLRVEVVDIGGKEFGVIPLGNVFGGIVSHMGGFIGDIHAELVVECVYLMVIAAKSFHVANIVDGMIVPQSVATEGGDAAIGGKTRAGEEKKLVHGGCPILG